MSPYTTRHSKRAKIHQEEPAAPSGRATGKAGFGSLPTEVVDMIFWAVPKRHPLLLIDKRCLLIAGPIIYGDGTLYTRDVRPDPADPDFADADTLPYTIGLLRVLEGIERVKKTVKAPFGGELKLRFLRSVKALHHTFVDSAILVKSGIALRSVSRLIKYFERLRYLRLEPFPNLCTLTLFRHNRDIFFETHPMRDVMLDPQREAALLLTTLCRPTTLDWSFGLYNTSALEQGNKASLLRFAGGHLPARVIHRPVTWTLYPIPCFGTLNEIHLSTHIMLDTSVTLAMYAGLPISAAQPAGNALKSLAKDDVERRERTSWEFRIVFGGGRWADDEGIDVFEEMERVLDRAKEKVAEQKQIPVGKLERITFIGEATEY
ncbi:hypothetical protein IAT38_007087 [Cryptococcus sp. DSM 104549]